MSDSAILHLIHSERAKYSKPGRKPSVGPSILGSECDKCVWRALDAVLNRRVVDPDTSPYWLGAELGTAFHDRLEALSAIHDAPGTVLTEHKLVVGEVGDLEIRGKIDRFEIESGRIVDYKGSTRKDKPALLASYEHELEEYEGEPGTHKKMRHKLRNYLGQLHMYGPALIEAGYEVNEVVLEFFMRDGSGDGDIYVLDFEYNPDFAEALWSRVREIAGNLDAEYESHPECFPCSMSL